MKPKTTPGLGWLKKEPGYQEAEEALERIFGMSYTIRRMCDKCGRSFSTTSENKERPTSCFDCTMKDGTNLNRLGLQRSSTGSQRSPLEKAQSSKPSRSRKGKYVPLSTPEGGTTDE